MQRYSDRTGILLDKEYKYPGVLIQHNGGSKKHIKKIVEKTKKNICANINN